MLEAQGITDPYKLAWMADYCENHIRVDRENHANGNKIIGDGIGELLGIEEGDTESMDKVQESLMFTEPDSTPILETEKDAEVFFNAIENPKEPNEALKNLAKEDFINLEPTEKPLNPRPVIKPEYLKEPTEKVGFFKRILNWFK